MKKSAALFLAVVTALGLFAWRQSQKAPEGAALKVPDFRMLDHNGASHRLYSYGDAAAIVLFWQGNGCPIVRLSLPKLRELEEKHAGKGVRFFMVNANPQDDLNSVAREAAEFGIGVPVLKDEVQFITRRLGVERTADAVLIDPKNWKTAYHGPLDDSLGYEIQKTVQPAPYLDRAIEALLSGKPVPQAPVETKGCLIEFPGAEKTVSVSYTEDVAPVLESKCLGCHRAGGIGSWAMSEYKKVKGWSPMMREVLLTRRMPPWGADPRYGDFEDDPSLSTEEYRTLLAWIQAGAPRGEGEDPLRKAASAGEPEWPLGEPDLVFELPEQELPASGNLPWKTLRIDTGLGEDKWIRAAHLKPSNPKVLHHGTVDTGKASKQFNMETDPTLHRIAAFVPGMRADALPEGTGSLLAAGDTLHFVLHYVTTGRPETDRPRLGLYFHKEKPPVRVLSAFSNFIALKIPPHAEDHAVAANPISFGKEALLYEMMPHAHYRCKSFKVTALYPDGGSEVLLSVPQYSFNWQRVYRFKQPKRLPAGTLLRPEAVYDNSARNPANPDPSQTVGFGFQSSDEMLLLYVNYSEA